MKKLVFSLLMAVCFTITNAQTESKRGTETTTPAQRGGMNIGTSNLSNSGLRTSTPDRFGNQNSFPSNRNIERPSNLPQSNAWQSMGLQEQRETVKNMSPKERNQLMQNIKENMAIEEIKVPEAVQEEFKMLLNDYMTRQKEIKEKFHTDKKIEKLSTEEASQKLNESFSIGQQLLDNRKIFAEKFLKILTPQQVLKLYQMEGKFRDKMLDKKYD